MKTIKICILFFLISINLFAQNNKHTFAYVDELEEFSATTWILAGCEEFDRGIYKPYYSDIQKSFGKFKSHPVMAFLKKMRDIPGDVDVISYNSLPIANHLLSIENGHLQVNQHVDLDEYFAKNDNRWTKETFLEYVELLDDFYEKSNYASFFKKHAKLYEKYLEVANQQLATLVSDSLFMSLYGEKLPEVKVCISPAYGVNNFSSLDIKTQKKLGFKTFSYSPILGVSCAPKKMLENDIIKSGTFIHELSHSFTAPLFHANKKDFLEIGRRIYPYVKDELYRSWYDADALGNEFFNTVMTIVYMQELHLSEYLISHVVATGGYEGYVWIDETMKFMKQFTDNRKQYPTIKEFMPLFIEHMYTIADRIDSIAKRPYIVSVTPEIGSVVEGNINEIKIVFSEPMLNVYATELLPNHHSIWPDSRRALRKYKLSPDDISKFENDTTFVLKVCVPLESGKSYGMGINTRVLYGTSNKYMSVGNAIKDIYFIVK